MKIKIGFYLLLFLFTFRVWSQEESSVAETSRCTVELPLTGTIGPASLSIFERGLDRAKTKSCQSILLLINTPGGSLQTTRLIVEKIINSEIPVLCLVFPSGGHAGSAGAIILQACHVNGAMVATNLGAATPIAGGGAEIPEDLRKKLLNDTRSWMEGITELRGRSKQFGQEIVTDAKAVSAEEAKKIGAIDFIGTTKAEFLKFAESRDVKMTENQTEKVVVGDVVVIEPILKDRFLDLFADPQIAYLLFMGSLALLYFEITHPGTMVAGVVGGVGLVLALIALHKLQVEWGGLLLIIFGLALLIAEAFLPSFGALGVGGIISFIMGSIFLFDAEKTGGYQLPFSLIFSTAGAIGAIMLGLAILSFRTFKMKPKWGGSEMLGRKASVMEIEDSGLKGQVEVLGELWRFQSPDPVRVGETVTIQRVEGLTLILNTKEIKET